MMATDESGISEGNDRTSSSLVAVARALLIYVDIFGPHLKWEGQVSAVDFVEVMFPMVADIVQNGWYCPPAGGVAVRASPSGPSSPTKKVAATPLAGPAALVDDSSSLSRLLRNKIRLAQADSGALWDLRHFASSAKTTMAQIRLGHEHMRVVSSQDRSSSPQLVSSPQKGGEKKAGPTSPRKEAPQPSAFDNAASTEKLPEDLASPADALTPASDEVADEGKQERNLLQDKQNRLVAELARIMKGPLGSGRRVPFFPTVERLRAYVEFVLSAVYAAADERNTQRLSWTQFESFLSDGAIVYSTQLGLEDITIYIQEFSDDVGGMCIFASSLSNGGIVVVVQTGTNLTLRYMVPVFNQSGNRMVFRTSSVATLYVLCAAEVVESKKILCGCSRHSALFFDVSSASLPVIQTFSLETLGDTPSCIRKSAVGGGGQEILVAAGMAGTLWGFRTPVWSPPTHQWEMGCVLWKRTEGITRDMIAQVIPAYADKYFFIASRSDVLVVNLPVGEVKHSLPTCHDGMNHCRFLVYNDATRYLVAGGETSFLLVWLSPNLADRRPVKLEDLVNPHSGILAGLLTHPRDPTIISLDMHGLMKFWSLARLSCVQNVRVPNAMNTICGLVWLRCSRLAVATYTHLTGYKVDDETTDASVASLVRSPKGGSITACVQRDVVEWGTSDGKKLVHHQNLCEADISSVVYGGNAILFLLLSNGSVACHASSSGKELAFYHRKIMRTEGVAMVFCSELRRAVVATVSSDIWFFSQTASEMPFRQQLTGGDAACTCIAIGTFEKTAKYFVGTHENSVQIFSLKPPALILFEHRIPPPATDGSVGHVVCLLFSNNCLLISDNLGWLRVHKGGKWQLIGAFDLEELERSYAEKLVSDRRGGPPAATAQPPATATHQIGRAHITKMEHYVDHAVVVMGDSVGRLWVLDVGQPSNPVVVKMFDAKGNVKQLAVDGDLFFTADDASNLFIWSSDGVLLGNLWGSQQTSLSRLPVISKPSWLDDCSESIDNATQQSMRAYGRLSATLTKSIGIFLRSRKSSMLNKSEDLSTALCKSFDDRPTAAPQPRGSDGLLGFPSQAPAGGGRLSRIVFNRASFCSGDDLPHNQQRKGTVADPTIASAQQERGCLSMSDDDDEADDSNSNNAKPPPPLFALPTLTRSESLFFRDEEGSMVPTNQLSIAWRGSQVAEERQPVTTGPYNLQSTSLCWGYPSLKNRVALERNSSCFSDALPPLLPVKQQQQQKPLPRAEVASQHPKPMPVHKIRTVGGGTIVGAAPAGARGPRSHSSNN